MDFLAKKHRRKRFLTTLCFARFSVLYWALGVLADLLSQLC